MIHTKKPDVDPLDLLANEAANNDAAAGPPADGQAAGTDAAPAVDMSNTQCLMMAFEVMRETLCSFAKLASPKQTMSNEIMQPVSEAIGAVLDKYGISLSGVAGDFMTEIKAAIVSVPVLLSIRAGVQAELRSKQAAIENPQNEAVSASD